MHCDISPEILNDLFTLKLADKCNLRDQTQFFIPNVKTVNHGFESLTYLGLKISEAVPSHLIEIDHLKNFKILTKNEDRNRVRVGSVKYIFKT